MAITLLTSEGREIRLDRNGYFITLDDWSEPVAEALAAREGLVLTTEHWEILQLLREFYAKFQLSPAGRPLIKYVAQRLGPGKGDSLHLNHLFKGAPIKLGTKLAGLPEPSSYLWLSRLPSNTRSPSPSVSSAEASVGRAA